MMNKTIDWDIQEGESVEHLTGTVHVFKDRHGQVSYIQENLDDDPTVKVDFDQLSVAELEAILKHKQKSETSLVPAKDVQDGHFFRKRTGTVVYVKLTSSSVRFLKLDPEKVYGVCDYGNVTVLDPDKNVVALGETSYESDEDWRYE
jgi:hypothetical protein